MFAQTNPITAVGNQITAQASGQQQPAPQQQAYTTRTGISVPNAATISRRVNDWNFYKVDAARTSQGTPLSLTGAVNYWKLPGNEDYIYVPGYNISGHVPNVIEALRVLTGGNDELVQQFLDTAFTSQNYNIPKAQGGKKEDFEAFKQFYDQERARKRDVEATTGVTASGQRIIPLEALPYIVSQISSQPAVVSTVPSTAPSSRSRVRGAVSERTRRPAGLADRLRSLRPGQVLDVSSATPSGTGIRAINQPGPASSKFGVEGLNIVSSDRNNFINALQRLGGETGEDYSGLVALWDQAAAAGTSRGRTSTRRGVSTRIPAQPIVSAGQLGLAQAQSVQAPPAQQTQFNLPTGLARPATTALPSLGAFGRPAQQTSLPPLAAPTQQPTLPFQVNVPSLAPPSLGAPQQIGVNASGLPNLGLSTQTQRNSPPATRPTFNIPNLTAPTTPPSRPQPGFSFNAPVGGAPRLQIPSGFNIPSGGALPPVPSTPPRTGTTPLASVSGFTGVPLPLAPTTVGSPSSAGGSPDVEEY